MPMILTFRRNVPADQTVVGQSYCLFIVSLLLTMFAADVTAKPNIVLILVDDLAWSDPACYGHPWHATPHFDRLAQEGMRLTSAYAPAPICSASRAAIMTGKTTARLHFEFVTKAEPGRQKIDTKTPLQAPPFTLNLPLEEQTIAEHLTEQNYRTAYFGKWHLNAHHNRYLGWSPTHGPQRQGFQVATEDFGGHPYSWGRKPQPSIDQSGQFPKDSMVERVCEFIAQPHDQPFFLMVSQFYVHTPVKTRCRWLLEKYDRLIPQDVSNRDERLRYAAFVETLDYYVGRIIDAIDQSKLQKQTLVVLTSDNGGHPEFTANSPLRGSKWNLYEGGIRVPMLIRWPGQVAAGSTCDVPVIGYDLLPTFVDIAGDRPVEHCDGRSLLALLNGNCEDDDRDLIWHFPYYHPEKGFAAAQEGVGIDDFAISRTRPQSAIRRGRYKLIQFHEDNKTELYDLSSDISEQQNLSHTNAAIAAELAHSLSQQLTAMNARFAKPTP